MAPPAQEPDSKAERVGESDFEPLVKDGVAEDDRAEDKVGELPDSHLVDADEELGVFGFGEGIVEGALANVLHQLGHTGADQKRDKAPVNEINTEEREDVVRTPVTQCVSVGEDDRKSSQRSDEAHAGLQQLDNEVHPVGQLVQDADPHEGPEEMELVPHQAPTAEYFRIPRHQTTRCRTSPKPTQAICIVRPCVISGPDNLPSRSSTGKATIH